MSNARERRYLWLIRRLNAAHDALAAAIAHEDILDGDDSRLRLKRDIAEYVGFLENATWWRSTATPTTKRER